MGFYAKKVFHFWGRVGTGNMNNLILFLNSFLSYLLLMLVAVALVGVAIFIGIRLRKSKDAKEAAAVAVETDGTQQ